MSTGHRQYRAQTQAVRSSPGMRRRFRKKGGFGRGDLRVVSDSLEMISLYSVLDEWKMR